MSEDQVADVMSLAVLAMSFVAQSETWPVFLSWANRPEFGPPTILTRAEAEGLTRAAGEMMSLAHRMAMASHEPA